MARYRCPGCGYTYDENLGDTHEGFAPGTPWSQVPEEWACADCAVRFKDLSPGELAERALTAMHAPVNYKPVETDGAARAAREIVSVMENRAWAAA